MIGEIRDHERREIAIQASMTGHLVFSTLHTTNSVEVVNRLRDMDIDQYLIADSVTAIIAQRLVRQICPHCKKAIQSSSSERSEMSQTLHVQLNTELFKGAGCARCRGTGYRGRTGIFELLVIDSQLKELINKGEAGFVLANYLNQINFTWMKEEGIKLASQGITNARRSASRNEISMINRIAIARQFQ